MTVSAGPLISSSQRIEWEQAIPSVFCGKAAICLPSRPSPLINLPTSAALSVLNFKTTPDSGSNVFNVSHAFGTFEVAAAPSVSASLLRFFGLVYFGESRFGMLYFVVIRVWLRTR